MADATLTHDTVPGGSVQHGHAGEFEAPLFGAYSKKVGMWLFLASDSLTFGALLFAFSYNRIIERQRGRLLSCG
jgi:heme/copper-type cytochrome/quinol oxidase subunit 3